MVCSCVVPSERVLLQMIFCSCVTGITFSREKWQIASLDCQGAIKIWKQTWWSHDKTIIEFGHRKISWFVSVSQINSFRLRQIFGFSLLTTDKSRYFAQSRLIIINNPASASLTFPWSWIVFFPSKRTVLRGIPQWTREVQCSLKGSECCWYTNQCNKKNAANSHSRAHRLNKRRPTKEGNYYNELSNFKVDNLKGFHYELNLF